MQPPAGLTLGSRRVNGHMDLDPLTFQVRPSHLPTALPAQVPLTLGRTGGQVSCRTETWGAPSKDEVRKVAGVSSLRHPPPPGVLRLFLAHTCSCSAKGLLGAGRGLLNHLSSGTFALCPSQHPGLVFVCI